MLCVVGSVVAIISVLEVYDSMILRRLRKSTWIDNMKRLVEIAS